MTRIPCLNSKGIQRFTLVCIGSLAPPGMQPHQCHGCSHSDPRSEEDPFPTGPLLPCHSNRRLWLHVQPGMLAVPVAIVARRISIMHGPVGE